MTKHIHPIDIIRHKCNGLVLSDAEIEAFVHAVVNLNNSPSEPCGACRQTIAEFSTPTTRIYFPAADGTTAEATLADLLPAAFTLQHPEK